MITFKSKIIIIASIVTCFLIQAQGADKYTDENRPYEFGFSIDGEQHRHEKKDENGLIMGEFGFITADGVYHVTVYATDEQGRFKILSMKNIRVKPYPTYSGKQSATPKRQGHSLDLPALPQATAITPLSTTENSLRSISIEPPGRSCSSCSIPTTSTLAPVVPQINQTGGNSPGQIGSVPNPKFPPQPSFISPQNANSVPPQQSNGFSPQSFGNVIPQAPNVNINNPTPQQTFINGNQEQNTSSLAQTPLERELLPPLQNSNLNPTQPQNSFAPQIPLEEGQISGPGSSLSAGVPEVPTSVYSPQSGTPDFPTEPQTPAINVAQGAPRTSQYPEGLQTPQNLASGRSPKRLDESSLGLPPPNSILRGSPNPTGFDQEAPAAPSKPTLISAQMQIVDKNTDIHHLGPGEKEGLPKGLTKDDMTHLLYTFNYTVGFHGHFEEGYTSGVKQGYYFVTGRNGVRTRIDYTADSEGFHPKISQEVLDLLSDDVPKPETEKEEKYGLKGYEFKWLYYPIEDRAS